ncbi:alanine racemase [Aliiglaciecola sp. 3_MG-2023]|uniref:alanine racemase n=1 Tax=Aliiglaciecola sp. 3_MG-2023 TaxID=3062644 RepID=UPI0026E207D7|nr:alanine racemase [Aliiglaciecola sp. 3_MG-2023]MDO6693635.1 alanine racemase [Aliiglaciecola sp. 3_MG-2023]
MTRPTEITIDLNALIANCHYAQSLSPDSQTVAVVKADAYGHGAAEIAKALEQTVSMFAVSSLEEGIELRQQGITAPILLLEGCFSLEELFIACQYGFSVVMHNLYQCQMLENLDAKQQIAIWLKVDTGMHRLGFLPEQVMDIYARLKGVKQVKNVVLMTHLSSADETNNHFTNQQIEKFANCHKQLESHFSIQIETSIANSAGLKAWPIARGTWNRPGIMLYGVSPFMPTNKLSVDNLPEHSMQQQLLPVMAFMSKVIALRNVPKGETVGYGNTWVASKDSVVATIAAGYGDGYPRTAKLGTPVLVNRQHAKLCGRVSMDMITVDVTGLTGIEIDSEVELWGKNLLVNEVASWADTIGYELVTRMPKRTRRRTINS